MLLFTGETQHGAQVKRMKGVGAGLSSVYRIPYVPENGMQLIRPRSDAPQALPSPQKCDGSQAGTALKDGDKPKFLNCLSTFALALVSSVPQKLLTRTMQ